MRYIILRYTRVFLPLTVLIVVVSQQSGTNVQTNVQTTGNSQVNVQTDVNTSGSNTSVYKKVEVENNGVKKVYESTDPGSERVEVESTKNGVEMKVTKDASDTAKNTATKSSGTKVEIEKSVQVEKDSLPYSSTYESIHNFIINTVKDFFKKLFNV